MDKNSYIKLSRGFFANSLWSEARTFSRCEAWLDLIQSARFDATAQPKAVCVGGREVKLCQGEWVASRRFLAKRWNWEQTKVQRFLNYLKKEEMITERVEEGANIISLTNYGKYNSPLNTQSATSNATSNATLNDEIIKDLARKMQQLAQQLAQQRQIIDQIAQQQRNKEEEKKENNKKLSDESQKVGAAAPSFFPHNGSNPAFIHLVGWVTENCPYCSDPAHWSHGMTLQEYERLRVTYGFEHGEILGVIAEIENRKDLRKRYTNLYMTVLKWLKMRHEK